VQLRGDFLDREANHLIEHEKNAMSRRHLAEDFAYCKYWILIGPQNQIAPSTVKTGVRDPAMTVNG